MKKLRYVISIILVLMLSTLSGCSVIDAGLVKLNFRNNDFDYIKDGKVNKIIIQSARDAGFKFIINDEGAIDDIYNVLKKGKVKDNKTSLDPDYYFEVYEGEDKKTYNYVVSVNERNVGNFYDDSSCYSISNLDDIITQNLSTIRKPRNFEDIYYDSILDVLKKKESNLSSGNNVGIDLTADVDCLKYIFSVDLESFLKDADKIVPGCKLVNGDANDYDTVVTVKNRGYTTKVFKTAITVDNKKDKTYETYYVQGNYEYKSWDITVSEPNDKPEDW